MKKYFFSLGFAAVLGALGVAAALAFASDIQYPVQELGSCTSQGACKSYCDRPSNTEACLDFAEANNLMSIAEIQEARKFLNAGSGPGGCTSRDSCESYCDLVEHIDECVTFAEKNGLMPPEELEEAKKVQAALARGVKMPACSSKKQCDAYCSDASHMEECIAFAQEAGFLSGQELEESKKVLKAIRAGAKPPPCNGKEECEAYCSQEEHFDGCFEFALAAGFVDPKEAEMMKKTRGKGPGGCRGREACEAFCQKDENMEACGQFAYENGMMNKEEFEMMKKSGGKGPGDCRGRDECENFCKNPANQETCFQFAKENGLMSEEDLQRMEQGKAQFRQAIEGMPAEVSSCLEQSIGANMLAKLKSGEAMPPQEIGDTMRECFEKNMPANMMQLPDGAGGMPQGGSGPGGCTNPQECQAYCQANPDECGSFGPGHGETGPPPGMPDQERQQFGPGAGQGMPPGAAGPGGCTNPEECQAYCQANPAACGIELPQGFGPGAEQGMPPEGMMPPEGGTFGPPPGESGPPPEAFTPPPSSDSGDSGSSAPAESVPEAPPAEQTAPPSSGE